MFKPAYPIPFFAPAPLDGIIGAPSEGQLDIGLVGDVYARDDFLAKFGFTRPSDLRETIWQPLVGSSLIIANLEAPITGQDAAIEKKPYLHKTTPAVLDIFDHRFVLSLANNHIMDFGPAGLFDTIAALDKAGIPYAGAGSNIDQAKLPRLLTVEGTQVAVICAADIRFYPATTANPGTCPAHEELLVDAIHSIKDQVALVIVSLHMGLEYVSIPSSNQINLANACLNAGAHIVHFHHAHCLSGAATNGYGVVLFGTGNYVFTTITKVPASRRTAAWRARFDTRTRHIIALDAKPLFIDEAGLPRPLEIPAANRELKRLRECSRSMLGGPKRQWARLKDLLNPYFLRINAYNYGFLLRKRGLSYVLKNLSSGARAQFKRKRG